MRIKLTLSKLLITILALSSIAYASNITLKEAIQKYKNGNYSGCIQDLEAYTRTEQSNALAYYYLAIANVQAGRTNNALQAYDRVLALKPNATLLDYATKGKICIEQPEYCYKTTSVKEEDTELDKFIKAKNQYVYKGLQTDSNKKNLDALKNRINSNEEIHHSEFSDYEKSSQNTTTDKEKIPKKPSDADIVAAIKVLNQAGLGSITTRQNLPNAQQTAQQNNQNEQTQQMIQAMMMQQANPYNNVSMMLGNNNNNNNNNQLMNMLPFILAQSNNQNNNGKPAISPEVMQAMMMQAMMPDLNFSSNDNKY